MRSSSIGAYIKLGLTWKKHLCLLASSTLAWFTHYLGGHGFEYPKFFI